jgi:molybdate transport system regulatory protein
VNPITVRLRIDCGSDRAIGPGKIELLEGVHRTGSLRQAAIAMGMSYRGAWLLMESLNASLASPATVATRGGHGGGGAKVTLAGLELIRTYRRLEAETNRAVQAQFARFVYAGETVPGTRRPGAPKSHQTSR